MYVSYFNRISAVCGINSSNLSIKVLEILDLEASQSDLQQLKLNTKILKYQRRFQTFIFTCLVLSAPITQTPTINNTSYVRHDSTYEHWTRILIYLTWLIVCANRCGCSYSQLAINNLSAKGVSLITLGSLLKLYMDFILWI